VLSLGGSNISGFAGVNPGTANKTGFTLSGISFALAMVTDSMDSSRHWTSLEATASSAALEGVSGFNLAGTALEIAVNRADEMGSWWISNRHRSMSNSVAAMKWKLDLDGELGDARNGKRQREPERDGTVPHRYG
jgi:hypothetical protein